MLGFNSASFTPSSFINNKSKDSSKKISKHYANNRFLVQQQNTFAFRNARRIFEIGLSTIQILDFHGVIRAEYNSSDIISVKLGGENDLIFTLNLAKTSETFVCGKRAELLSALYPTFQKEEGAPMFELSKWSKLRHIEQDSLKMFTIYKLWATRLVRILDGRQQSSHHEIYLNNISRICAVREDPSGAVIFLKSNRMVRFSCCEEAESSSVRQFAARDRFITALAETAKLHLGYLIPVAEISSTDVQDVFNEYHLRAPADAGKLIWSVSVRRYGRDFQHGKVKRRHLEMYEKCVLERDSEAAKLICRRILHHQICFLIRPEDFTDVFGMRLEDHSTIWFSSEVRDCVLINILELAELNGVILTILAHEIPPSSKLQGSVEMERDFEDSLLTERISSSSLKDDGFWRELLDCLIDNLTVAGACRCSSKKPLTALVQALTEVSTDPCGLSCAAGFGNSSTVGILAVLQKVAYSRNCFEEASSLKKESIWATLLALVQSGDDVLSYSAITTLKAFTCFQPSKQNLWKNDKHRSNIEKAESLNRSLLLDVDMMTLLLGRLRRHVSSGKGSKGHSTFLSTYAILDLLHLVTGSITTGSVSTSQRQVGMMMSNQQMITLSQVLSCQQCEILRYLLAF
jgi:hypothetical protein